MESIKLPFKKDAFTNPIYARVNWLKNDSSNSRPLAIVYHAGGLIAGSCEVIPQPQIEHLCKSGFVVVMPNYRLAPQATAKEAFTDAEDAFDWATTKLPTILHFFNSAINVDPNTVIAMGHSSGGTMVLHLASLHRQSLRAVLALYPFLFVSDKSTNGHQPTITPPFDQAANYTPTDADWAVICPAGRQLSEAPLPMDPSLPRNRWLFHLFKTGKWLEALQPDGDLGAIDPMTRVSGEWPPVMLIHGSEDNVSGRSVELVRRAEKEMLAGGVKESKVKILQGEGHLFDHHPSIGTSDQGPKWQAVLAGLQWLTSRGFAEGSR